MIRFINNENESLLRWFYSLCEPRNFSLILCPVAGCIQTGWGSDLCLPAVVLWNSAPHVSTMLGWNLDLSDSVLDILQQLGVVHPRVQHDRSDALVAFQDSGYLRRNIENTSSINNKLISRDLRFRHHIDCFCSIFPTKNIPNTATVLLCVSEWHDGVWFLNESIV